MEQKDLQPIVDINNQQSSTPTQDTSSKPVFSPTGTVEVIEYQQVPNPPPQPQQQTNQKTNKFTQFIKKYPLIVLLSIILVIGMVAGVIWITMFSKSTKEYNDVTVEVQAPKEIPMGSTREWKITVTNNNPVPIFTPSLFLETDQNFRYGSNTSSDSRTRFDSKSTTYFLDTMEAKQTRIVSFDAQALGGIQDTTTLTAKLTFSSQLGVNGATTIYTINSPKYVTTIIASDIKAEITKELELVEVKSDASVTFKFENVSDKDIPNLRVEAKYPSQNDFSYRSSQYIEGLKPAITTPSEGNNIWNITTFPKKTTFSITVTGQVQANAKTELPFTFGIYSLSADKQLKKIVEKSDVIKATPQSLAISTYLNGVKEFFKPATVLEVVVEYENRSSKSINGLELSSTINDPANLLDYSKISVITGTPSTIGKTVVWKAGSLAELVSLQPGAKGVLRYNIPVKSATQVLNGSFEQEKYTLQPVAEIKQTDKPSITASSALAYKMAGELGFSMKASEIKDKNQTVFAGDSGEFKIVRIQWEISTKQNKVKDLVIESSSPLTSVNKSSPVYNPLSISPSNYADKLLFNDKDGTSTLMIRLNQDLLDNYLGSTKSIMIVYFDLKIPAALTPNPLKPVYNAVTILNKTTVTGVDAVTGESYKFEAAPLTFGAIAAMSQE